VSLEAVEKLVGRGSCGTALLCVLACETLDDTNHHEVQTEVTVSSESEDGHLSLCPWVI
jgi:hypothetical protein